MFAIKNKNGTYFNRHGEWSELSAGKTNWFDSWISANQYRFKNIPDSIPCEVTTSHNILMGLIWDQDERVKNQTVVSNGEGIPSRIDSDGVPRPIG